MDGILNINKPPGKTSYSIVATVKRLSGERRVGHAGTLDPDATGVLPVCLGRGTRIAEFLLNTTKTYRAQIELGKATDTYDGSGRITQQEDPSGIDITRLEQVLESFRGTIRQTPPMYSALKHKGQPLYRLARAGINIERQSRTVKIHHLELISWEPPVATVEIECSKGTYIRSLAHDLGQALGCGAYLKSLVRTRYGIFDIKDAISLLQLEEAVKCSNWQQYLHPIDSVLRDFPSLVVDEVGEAAIKTGRPLSVEDNDINSGDATIKYCRAYSPDGRFLGVLRYIPDTGVWQPKKVML